MDDVLTYNFAYGSKGDKLKGKDMQLLVSVGGHASHYSGFDIFASIPELLRPFQLTANLVQMNYLLPEWMFRADSAAASSIEAFGEIVHGVRRVVEIGQSHIHRLLFLNSLHTNDSKQRTDLADSGIPLNTTVWI